MRSVEGLVACFFLRGNGGIQLTGGDLFGAGGDVAELAGGEVAFGSAHGWAEGAADYWAVLVEIAGSGSWIEDRAGFVFSDRVVGVIREEECVLVIVSEDARSEIAGKDWADAGERGSDAVADAGGALRVLLFEDAETVAQPGSILLRDRKDTVAALGAAGTADEVMPAAFDGRGKSGVDDLNKAGIAIFAVALHRRYSHRLYFTGNDGLVYWKR